MKAVLPVKKSEKKGSHAPGKLHLEDRVVALESRVDLLCEELEKEKLRYKKLKKAFRRLAKSENAESDACPE